MIDLMRDVLGKELSAGLVAYGVLVLVVSQPIAKRIAERDHLRKHRDLYRDRWRCG